MSEPKQPENDLLNDEIAFDPNEEWWGMPEFIQEKQEPFSKIILRFETEEDLLAFGEKIGQTISPRTKSLWFPCKSHWGLKGLVYKDEP